MIDSSIRAAGAFVRSQPEFKDRFGKVFADPRPDIDGDRQLWVTLFAESDRVSPNLSDALFGLRCVGARLEPTESGYVLRPHIDASGNCGFKDWAEYRDQADNWLKPHVGPLKILLGNLAELNKKWWGS